jgi:hypothetical protein
MRSRSRHSLATQLSGAALGRVLGVDQAASMLGVDRNSIRRWMKNHPPDDDWRVVEELGGAQLVERMAKGEIRSPRDLAIIKGIAGRNLRARELIARREQRWAEEQAPEPPSPMQDAVQALSDEQRRMLVAEIDVLLEARSLGLEVGVQVPRPDAGLQVAEWFGVIASLPAEEVAERTEAAETRLREFHEQQYEDRRLLPGVDRRGNGVEPTPQSAQGPMAPVTAIRVGDRAEGMLADVGQSWQWRRYDR